MTGLSVARVGLVCLLAVALRGAELSAQRLGSIIGTVRTSSQGPFLEGSRVTLVGTLLVTTTNARGEFAFQGITPGKYVIQASAIGFATLSSPIEVKALETLEIEFEVDPEAARLPDVNVTEAPNLPAEFVRRKSEGGGRYFTRADIERRHPNSVAELLRTVPGMRVECRGVECRAMFNRAPRNCPPAYFIDGAPAHPSFIWLQTPNDLDGVEVYSGPAETPPELNRYSSCGAIVLWTRTPPRATPKEKKKP
jgi:hypothetical protein